MGISTDAYLFFGFELNEADDQIEFTDNVIEMIESQDNLDDEDNHDVLEFLGQRYGFKYSSHCSSECPVYFVYSKIFKGFRGYSHKFDSLPTAKESDVKRLKEISYILLGKEIEPKWILASDWC